MHIAQAILFLNAGIDEFERAWRALGQLAEEQLSALKKVASIESIGSSTRIEGNRLSDQEEEALLGKLSIKSLNPETSRK